MLLRQSLCGSFIEIKGVGRNERKRDTERKRKRKKRQGPACLFRRAVGKERWGGRSFSLKGTFAPVCRLGSDVAAIGPWAGQGTA